MINDRKIFQGKTIWLHRFGKSFKLGLACSGLLKEKRFGEYRIRNKSIKEYMVNSKLLASLSRTRNKSSKNI